MVIDDFSGGTTVGEFGLGRLRFDTHYLGGRHIFSVYIPLWIIAALCIPYPVLFLRRLLRPRKRNLHNQCRHCAYDLTGNVSGVCPECGTNIVNKASV